MATIKSFTSLEQSKNLAEILPLESADMHWSKDFDGSWFVDLAEYTSVKIPKYVGNVEEHLLPCWSLASLLSVLPAECECMSLEHINYGNNHKKYFMSYVGVGNTDTYDNPVDACVELIWKLNELNLL